MQQGESGRRNMGKELEMKGLQMAAAVLFAMSCASAMAAGDSPSAASCRAFPSTCGNGALTEYASPLAGQAQAGLVYGPSAASCRAFPSTCATMPGSVVRTSVPAAPVGESDPQPSAAACRAFPSSCRNG